MERVMPWARLHQVSQVAPQTIKASHHQRIPSTKRLQHLFEPGAQGVLAASLFFVELLASVDRECIALAIERLIFRRDSGVAYVHVSYLMQMHPFCNFNFAMAFASLERQKKPLIEGLPVLSQKR